MAQNISNTGTFVNAQEAKANVDAYLKDTGAPQPGPHHVDHVFGHVFGLAKVKKLIANIDKHNEKEKDTKKHIAGIRVYHAKSVRAGKERQGSMRDLVVVPVTKNGHDYPEKIHHGAEAPAKPVKANRALILTGSGPCPNVCGS